jgi:hypothetical protein
MRNTIGGVRTALESVVDVIQTKVDGATTISSTDPLTTNLNSMSTSYNNFQVQATGDTTVYPCIVCSNLQATTTAISTVVTTSIGPIRSQLNDVRDFTKSQLTDIKDTIVGGVNSAYDAIADSDDKFSADTRVKVHDWVKNVNTYESQRWMAAVILFCLPGVILILFILTGITKSGTWLKINFFYGIIPIILIWILFGALWMAGMSTNIYQALVCFALFIKKRTIEIY